MTPLVTLSAGVLLAFAGGSIAVRAHRLIALHQRALAWPSVPGVVLRSELREKTDGDGTSYQAELVCAYSAGGHCHTTARHTGGGSFSQPEQSARALVKAYPAGLAVEIRIDPADAAEGVLISGTPGHMVVMRRIGLAALIAGIGLVFIGVLRGP